MRRSNKVGSVKAKTHNEVSRGEEKPRDLHRRVPLRAALCAVVLLLLATPEPSLAVNPDWTTPLPPFRIADNLFYVGSRDLAAYLIVTPAGNILINSNYTSSPPTIRHSVEQLGFRWRDTRILLISHGHVDHAGGSAEVVRETGAAYEVMDGDVDVVESGGRRDFAFGSADKTMQFPAAHVAHVLHDGENVRLGGVTLVAHRTPGHTRGCTTWTIRAHLPGEPAGQLRDVVIVGSWFALSNYRLLGTRSRPASYPGIAADFETTFAVLHRLPCDVFLGAHGSYFGMLGKLSRLPANGARVWVDPTGYDRALAAAEAAYRTKVTAEQVAASTAK